MNATNPLGPAGPTTVIRPRRKAVAAQSALTRERATAIFGPPPAASPLGTAPAREPVPGRDPASPPESVLGGEAAYQRGPVVPPDPVPRLEHPPPPPPELSSGLPRRESASRPLGGLRTWLLLRCGLELRTVLALAVVLLVAAGLAVQHYVSGRPRAVPVPPAVPSATPSAASAAPPYAKPRLTIDVAGKVARPGLRQLPAGSRVADALAAAGGPLPGTDTTALNLARPLTDGEQLLVGLTPPPAPDASTAARSPGAPAGPVSLNSATAAQLDALPGVGPVLAQHIIDFRTQHGGFTSLQQLRQVDGIGDRKFTTLKALVQP